MWTHILSQPAFSHKEQSRLGRVTSSPRLVITGWSSSVAAAAAEGTLLEIIQDQQKPLFRNGQLLFGYYTLSWTT